SRALFFFFFFQAEDGIRDKLVTGVQTCALPISVTRALVGEVRVALALRARVVHVDQPARAYGVGERAPRGERHVLERAALLERRSEERRVGKGCRSGRSR